jgi:hypothetical protein
LLLGTIGEHGPDAHVVGAAVGGVGVGDMAAIGRPSGEVAAAAVVGELAYGVVTLYVGCDLNEVDVLPTGGTWAVLAFPGEGNELTIGRP